MFGKRKVAALVGELLGTGALTLVFLAVSRSSIGLPYFVALAVGVAVTVLVFLFGTATSGAHLNPAVTLGFWTVRRIKTLDAILYIAVQFLGAYLAYLLFAYFVGSSLPNTAQAFTGKVLVAEALGAFVLAFGWATAFHRGHKQLAFSAIVGLSATVGVFLASSASLGLLNPALALGTRYWDWAYALGPVLGALVGFNLYSLLFATPDKQVDAATTGETVIVNETIVAEVAPAKSVRKTAAKTAKPAARSAKAKTTKK